ncbi:Possible periplasmic protein [hydrothermal vent metagenome]|uniref:Possible periplasmic protein n=1 Tax=hydrothermal vent metagenome TaxID=652676 RepID=A0A3B1E4A2_9ZZZZ
MFRLFVFFVFFIGVCFAKNINAIAIKVGSEIITTYDILEFAKKNGKSKKESAELLVDILVKKEAIKKSNINIDLEKINNYIRQIAYSSGVSVDILRNNVLKQMSWSNYIDAIKEKIKNEEFEKKIIISEISKKSDDDFIDFYNKNKENFKIYGSIEVFAYTSLNKQLLLRSINNPLSYEENVHKKKQTLLQKEFLDKNIYRFLSSMKLKTFSPIIRKNNKFVSYFVTKKSKPKILEYDKVALMVKELYARKNKEIILKKYLKLIKINSSIVYVQSK